jgi:FkbM family methyltransferase
LASARQFIRSRRHWPVLRGVAAAAEKYLRAYYNEDFYDFALNGEAFVLAQFDSWLGGAPTTIWDVGANRGNWADEAHNALPKARVVSFEMVPEIFQQLATHIRGQSWITAECLGLSDREGRETAYWSLAHDSTSAVSPSLGQGPFASGEVRAVDCQFTTGDLYAAKHGAPTFIKVDTEGHELSVLRGCQTLLEGGTVKLVQFEYGSTFHGSGARLGQIYELLSPLGYSIGRLFPNHVDFRPYSLQDETFRMGNYIAVCDDALKRCFERP